MIRGIVDIRVVTKYIEVIVMLISLAIIVVAVGKCTPASHKLFPREFRSFESNIFIVLRSFAVCKRNAIAAKSPCNVEPRGIESCVSSGATR